MIAFLQGKLAGRTLSSAYINVAGVGYEVFMPVSDLAKLPEENSEVTVLTYLQVSDAGIALYGFNREEEKVLFQKLIGVSGVGPKMALAALSTFTPQALADAVAAQDTALLSKIPGVGKKTASRIVLELKGSLEKEALNLFSQEEPTSTVSAALQGAQEALLSMGFTSAEVDLALKNAPENASESKVLQYALKRLGNS